MDPKRICIVAGLGIAVWTAAAAATVSLLLRLPSSVALDAPTVVLDEVVVTASPQGVPVSRMAGLESGTRKELPQ